MINENMEWFNQNLFYHQDKLYDTDGILRISISTGTSNYKDFTAPKILFQVSNKPLSKTFQFGLYETRELLKTINNLRDDPYENKYEVIRKGSKGLHFKIEFTHAMSEKVIVFSLINSTTDFTKVIVDEEIFGFIMYLFSKFKDDYNTIWSGIFSSTIISLRIEDLIEKNVKGIHSSIQSGIEAAQNGTGPAEEFKEAAEKTEYTIKDLENFVGEDMENVKIPEIDEEKKEILPEVESNFVKYSLKNDLMNLEHKINSYVMSPNPVGDLAKMFQNELSGNDSDTEFLPGINSDDMKSLCYLTKLICATTERNHIEGDLPIPSSLPIFMYIPSEKNEYNLELSYDLFLIHCYMRFVRRRLETRGGLGENNKKDMYYLRLRCYTDPFVYGFIVDKADQIETMIVSRFDSYKKNNFFKRYEQLLSDHNCPEITREDILTYIREFKGSVSKIMPINMLHDKLREVNNLRLESKNIYNLEQIINEIIPLEVEEKLGKDLKDADVLEKIAEKYDVSQEILQIFLKELPIPKAKKHRESALQKVVSIYIEEIPEQYRDKFIEHIKNLGEDRYDFLSSEFPLEELGENIIKVLYNWRVDEDKKLKKLANFKSAVENEYQDKNSILLLVKEPKNENEDTANIADMIQDFA